MLDYLIHNKVFDVRPVKFFEFVRDKAEKASTCEKTT